LNQIYNSEENDKVFLDNELLLCAIFSTKGTNRGNTYLELEKSIFLSILKEAGVIKVPQVKKVETKGDEKKKNSKAAAEKKEEEKKEEAPIP
jgi:hypothetical protein